MTRKKTKKTVVWAKTSRRRRRKQPFIVCWPTTHTHRQHTVLIIKRTTITLGPSVCSFHLTLQPPPPPNTLQCKVFAQWDCSPFRFFPSFLRLVTISFPRFLSTLAYHTREHTNWENWKRLETREKEAEAPATPAHFALSYKADRHRRGGVVNSSGSHYSTTTTRQCNAMAHSVTLCLFLDRSRTEERRAGQLFGGAWTELVC